MTARLEPDNGAPKPPRIRLTAQEALAKSRAGREQHVRRAQRLTRGLVRESKTPRRAVVGAAIEPVVLSMLLLHAELVRHGLGRRGRRLEISQAVSEHAQVCVKLLDRLDGASMEPEKPKRPEDELRRYLEGKGKGER